MSLEEAKETLLHGHSSQSLVGSDQKDESVIPRKSAIALGDMPGFPNDVYNQTLQSGCETSEIVKSQNFRRNLRNYMFPLIIIIIIHTNSSSAYPVARSVEQYKRDRTSMCIEINIVI